MTKFDLPRLVRVPRFPGARRWNALALAVALLSAVAVSQADQAPGTNCVTQFPDESVLLHGLMVYQKNCVFCHGRSGDGRGEMGLTVQPRPRDFRKGIFKFRSTPPGFLPRNEDLQHTIRTGVSGTAMPVFDKLPERDVRAVIEYIKTFSPRWQKGENYSSPVKIPPRPDWFLDENELKGRILKGRALFTAACASCHGDQGDGKGPSAPALEDSFGEPCPPSDLRRPNLRSGTEPAAVYRVLVTGFDSTPMPSFAEAFTPEQVWEIAAFVKSLQKSRD